MATLTATPAEAPASSQRVPRWPFLLYALTGFTGVLAEQGFEKYMSLLVGATAAASAVVIFAYFLGFALGAGATGMLVRRGRIARPLRTYGLLELLVGISCVAFSYWFHPIMGVLAPWQAFYASPLLKFAVRFAFGSVLILPTAALMGASFPLIAQAVDRRNESHGHSWLRAYALNLTGAVIAALSGAYATMPLIGIRGAMWLCFAICFAVFAVCVIARENRTTIERRDEVRAVGRLDRDAKILLAGAFASGFVFFALEVIWTHLIGIAIGTSVYAFSAMLTMVLLGLLIGAFRVDRIFQKQSRISYSKIFQFTALLLVIQLRMWDWGQTVFIIDLPRAMQNFFAVETIKLALAAMLIVPSAAMLGAIYPCLLRSPVLERPGQSFLTGYLNSWNSLGCLTGAIAGIFFLIPTLGAEWSLKLMIVAAVGVSLLFLWRENPPHEASSRKAWKTALGGIAIVLIYAGVTRWDKRLLASGMNVYFGQVSTETPEQKRAEGPARDAELIFFDEAAQGGITSVIEFTDPRSHAKERVLLTNGKFEGSDDLDKQGRAQIGLAAIPSQYVSDTGRALLIGLGTGHSALALSRMGYGEVDVAEFAPGIIKASKSEFAQLTEGALDFPHVSVKLEDGRNLLQTNTGRLYDLITVEITSVWFAGATNVYSREFYELTKKRLKPGGVLQQWIQLHHISAREVECAIATVRSVYPYVSFWYFGGQGMIVASSEPQSPAAGREEVLRERMRSLVRRDAATQKQVADEMFQARVMSPEAVDRMVAQQRPVINTDHNRWIEYATPRYNSSNADWLARNLEALRSFEKKTFQAANQRE